MSTIATISGSDRISDSRAVINTNFSNLNTDKAESSAVTTAISNAIDALYPVGSLYFNATNNTNPGTLLGFGTWTAFGAGKMLVGLNSSDTDFDTAEETGGAKTADLSHTHTGPSHTHTGPSHTHTVLDLTTAQYDYYGGVAANTGQPAGRDYLVAGHSHPDTGASGTGNTGASGTGNTGSAGSATQSIMNPYIVVYIWKRTA